MRIDKQNSIPSSFPDVFEKDHAVILIMPPIIFVAAEFSSLNRAHAKLMPSEPEKKLLAEVKQALLAKAHT